MCTTHVVKLIPNMAHFTSLRGNKDAEMPISLYCCAPAKQRRPQILQLVSIPLTAKCSTWHSFCHFLHKAIFHQKLFGPQKEWIFAFRRNTMACPEPRPPKKKKKAIGGALSLATRVYMLAAFFFSVVIYCDRLMANIDFALRTLAQAGWIFRRCCTGKSPHPLDRSSVVWHATSPIPNGKIGFHKPYINTKDIYLGGKFNSNLIWVI